MKPELVISLVDYNYYLKLHLLVEIQYQGVQWLSDRVLDSRPSGLGFKPQGRHCVVVLEQDTFILA